MAFSRIEQVRSSLEALMGGVQAHSKLAYTNLAYTDEFFTPPPHWGTSILPISRGWAIVSRKEGFRSIDGKTWYGLVPGRNESD